MNIGATKAALPAVPSGEKLFTLNLYRKKFGLKWQADFKSTWFEEYLKYMTRTLESKVRSNVSLPTEGAAPSDFYPMQKIYANFKWYPLEVAYDVKEWNPELLLNIAPFARVGVGNGLTFEPFITPVGDHARAWAEAFSMCMRRLHEQVYGVTGLRISVEQP